MQIETIKVTNKEVEQAVTDWLRKHFGLTVQIKSVSKRYTHLDGWEVELETDDKGQVVPATSIVEQILAPVVVEKSDEDKYIDSLQPDAVRGGVTISEGTFIK